MSVKRLPRLRTRLVTAGLVLVAVGLPLSGCKEVESETAAGYEPAKLEEIKGTDMERVTFTAEGADRLGLKTAKVRTHKDGVVIPYRALIYDPEGKTYAYTSPKDLQYVRKEVKVDRIRENRVILSKGPPTGTEVVTVGAAEVYGTELDVAGSH